ncbi:methyltransferase [Yeosuana aromativorans]|uniref:Methyltransferase n=1 Tax=Yeosuana aromativorans TaxID=288019 RepID=A0A8J3BEI4_9FLAO|nr:class I SAM-dependent methyltransferase [Yeosuana aromativorans]GGK15519.1 methyltransferase [Yeosuana aromativorans]
MPEFWESVYKSNERMWGENPTDNARNVLAFLQKHNIKNLLIPGFGYGRNAKVFYDEGFDVTGIEISKTAIERARNYFGSAVTIHHGSVTEMPFDTNQYQSIYCYSLIHLLNAADRKKLIADCYAQLKPNGIMVFVALSTNDKRFGLGEELDKNTFHSPQGLTLYFYDEASIQAAFGNYHIIEAKEINEPEENPNEKHWMIVCEKKTAHNNT